MTVEKLPWLFENTQTTPYVLLLLTLLAKGPLIVYVFSPFRTSWSVVQGQTPHFMSQINAILQGGGIFQGQWIIRRGSLTLTNQVKLQGIRFSSGTVQGAHR